MGLFGFTEVRTTAGIVAAIIDVAAFAVLATAVILALNLGRQALPATAAASVVALALTGAFVATPKTQPVASGAQTLKARQIGGVNLLTDAKGLTLYWFAPDSPNKSVCYGSCAAYWPPVAGNASAGPASPGRSARSSGPTAPRRPPTTGIRCTPISATARPARTAGTTST